MAWNTLVMRSASPCARMACAVASAFAQIASELAWPCACSSAAFLSNSTRLYLSMAC